MRTIKRLVKFAPLVAGVILLGLPLWPGASLLSAQSGCATTRVSVASDGTQGNGNSAAPSISADGRYVAFASSATNLVPDDTNASDDVFVRDIQTGQTTRVSVATDRSQGNLGGSFPDISSDGRYVVFASPSTNLVEGDTNVVGDVFVHDMQTGLTGRVSVASDGTQANGGSFNARISANGRYVAFISNATNLVPGDTNGVDDIFVHDMQTAQTGRASVASDGTQASRQSWSPAVSADGRYLAFASDAVNLVPGDGNGVSDTFVRDMQTGQTTRVSVASDGGRANGGSPFLAKLIAISGDGRYVSFVSNATNLVPEDTNGATDVFVHDMQTGQTRRVSVPSDGTQGNHGSDSPSFSSDGRYVSFTSAASNLVPGETSAGLAVFVHDMRTGWTTRASIACDGAQENGISDAAVISADGRYVAFWSSATNMVPGDTNGSEDVLVRDRGSGSLSYLPLVMQGIASGW